MLNTLMKTWPLCWPPTVAISRGADDGDASTSTVPPSWWTSTAACATPATSSSCCCRCCSASSASSFRWPALGGMSWSALVLQNRRKNAAIFLKLGFNVAILHKNAEWCPTVVRLDNFRTQNNGTGTVILEYIRKTRTVRQTFWVAMSDDRHRN